MTGLGGAIEVTSYTVIVKDHILDLEVMKIETESKTLALGEAEHYSLRYGVACVYENPSGREVARFRSGSKDG